MAIGSAIFAYCWILDTAEVYGDLIESVFDLYRGLLYQSIRRAQPDSPEEEREAGQKLTEYLWRGF